MASATSATRVIQPKAALKSSNTKRLWIASRPSTSAQPSRAGRSSERSASVRRGMSALHREDKGRLSDEAAGRGFKASCDAEEPNEAQADRDQHQERERHGERHPGADTFQDP